MTKCKWCGEIGDCNGTIDECLNCWEVRKRIREFLRHKVNRNWLILTILKGAMK